MSIYKGTTKISGVSTGNASTLSVNDTDVSDPNLETLNDDGGTTIAVSSGDITIKVNSKTDASTNATDGHVLTADGSGGVAWEAASGGGGGSLSTNTWTVTAQTGLTFSNTVYYEIGNLVHCWGNVDRSGSPTGNLRIPKSDLPQTPAQYMEGTGTWSNGGGLSGNKKGFVVFDESDSFVYFYGDDSDNELNASSVGNSSFDTMCFFFTYLKS